MSLLPTHVHSFMIMTIRHALLMTYLLTLYVRYLPPQTYGFLHAYIQPHKSREALTAILLIIAIYYASLVSTVDLLGKYWTNDLLC
jgi:hypothetical protein